MDDEPSLSAKIIGFVVTLIAIPVLFVATCVPTGFLAMGVGSGDKTAFWFFGVYGILFVGFGLWRAVVTKNPGVRWGIIVALAAAAIAAVLWFIPNVTSIGR